MTREDKLFDEMDEWADRMVKHIVGSLPSKVRRDNMVAGGHFGLLASRLQVLARRPTRAWAAELNE